MPDDNYLTGEEATAGLRRFIAEGRHLKIMNEQPSNNYAEAQAGIRLRWHEIPDGIRECVDEVRRKGMPSTQYEVEYTMQIGPINMTDEQWESIGIRPHP